MKFLPWITWVKNRIVVTGLSMLPKPLSGGFSIYFGNSNSLTTEAVEREFKTVDGRCIPIYKNYRYSIKVGWTAFDGLRQLAGLRTRNRLEASELAFLKNAIGTRAVTVTAEEAILVATKAVNKSLDLFIPETKNGSGLLEFLPDKDDLKSKIRIFQNRHTAMFAQLAAAEIFKIRDGASVLEIGFTTGGHSIFAFERLGFKAFGIDNFYGGLLAEQTLHGNHAKMLESGAVFEVGDITKTTPFPSECMDVIFSTSVLEHIQNLPHAFAEMFRLLKPGGAIIHNYSPYFSADGGHALGIGDSPWIHVRLDQDEYLRYLKELRPNEFPLASDWIKAALHRNMPQWKVQRLIAAAGFHIAFWMAKPCPRRWLKDLTPSIMSECFSATPEIGIEDLISRTVSFVAIKP